MYRSPNIVRVIRCKIIKWAGRVARMEEDRSAYKIITCTPAGHFQQVVDSGGKIGNKNK